MAAAGFGSISNFTSAAPADSASSTSKPCFLSAREMA